MHGVMKAMCATYQGHFLIHGARKCRAGQHGGVL